MNLTVTVDYEVLKRARIRALEQGTSVNSVVREFLSSYAGNQQERDARAELVKLARSTSASSGDAGRSWNRADLYADRLGRYGKKRSAE